jgi:hypothetical protein
MLLKRQYNSGAPVADSSESAITTLIACFCFLHTRYDWRLRLDLLAYAIRIYLRLHEIGDLAISRYSRFEKIVGDSKSHTIRDHMHAELYCNP